MPATSNVPCDLCRNPIPRAAPHLICESTHVICRRCAADTRTHATLYPWCRSSTHDTYDHRVTFASYSKATRHVSRRPTDFRPTPDRNNRKDEQ